MPHVAWPCDYTRVGVCIYDHTGTGRINDSTVPWVNQDFEVDQTEKVLIFCVRRPPQSRSLAVFSGSMRMFLKASGCYSSTRNPGEDKRMPGKGQESVCGSCLCLWLAGSPGLFCLFGFNFSINKIGIKMPSSQDIMEANWDSKCESSVFISVFSPLTLRRRGMRPEKVKWLFQHQLLAELGWELRLLIPPGASPTARGT